MKSHAIFIGIILDYAKQLEIENVKLKKQIKKLKRKYENDTGKSKKSNS